MNYRIVVDDLLPMILKTEEAADSDTVFGDYRTAKIAAIALLKAKIDSLKRGVKDIRGLRERAVPMEQKPQSSASGMVTGILPCNKPPSGTMPSPAPDPQPWMGKAKD